MSETQLHNVIKYDCVPHNIIRGNSNLCGWSREIHSTCTTLLDQPWICPTTMPQKRVKHVPHENQTTVSQWNNPYPSHNMAELNCTVGYWLCPDEQCPSLWLPRLLAPLQWWTTCNQLRSKEHFNSTRIWKLVSKHSQFSVC